MGEYRWWTVTAWKDTSVVGVKLGPLTVFTYRWLDDRRRIAATVLGGRERILYGGPL